MRLPLALALAVSLAACAARVPPRPSGAPAPLCVPGVGFLSFSEVEVICAWAMN